MDASHEPLPVIARRREDPKSPVVAPFTADLLPPRVHVGLLFSVHTEVIWPAVTKSGELRGPPHLKLRWAWTAKPTGTIVGFRRMEGFGKDGDFGECIVNSALGGEKLETLGPGEYFYTFCARTSLGGMFRVYAKELQFSEIIPSIPAMLELMRQAIDYRKLEQEYQKLTMPPAALEEPLHRWEREFSQAMAGISVKVDAGNRLRKEWSERKKAIEDGEYTPAERTQILRSLNGVMRELREKFEL